MIVPFISISTPSPACHFALRPHRAFLCWGHTASAAAAMTRHPPDLKLPCFCAHGGGWASVTLPRLAAVFPSEAWLCFSCGQMESTTWHQLTQQPSRATLFEAKKAAPQPQALKQGRSRSVDSRG
mmetsp:Transcript_48292/g.133855  ORF Transcript_48292/g.133855 Transcript_48292/m.133855 type:complete len:125 (-) Transcript_48292:554-928(-)